LVVVQSVGDEPVDQAGYLEGDDSASFRQIGAKARVKASELVARFN